MGTENEYGGDQIQILEGLEAVRKRPGMYIGSTSARGLHHLVYEIVDNAVDEALAGFCDTVKVYINEDNSITVRDNGRGIPVGINKKKGIPAVEVVFTILHAGGKFGGGGYKVSGGLHGVGASVVNALSTWLEVDIFHEGKIYRQRYERGKVMYPLKIVGDTDKRGTEVRFLPDPTIFEETVFDFSVLKQRLREMAFLTKGLKIVLKDKRPEENVALTFHYEGGIREYVEYLNKSKYDDDEDAWYYADGSGNIYAGEFKTIKGKKYAFRTDGRMINGLKFIQKDNNGKITDVKADDDDPNFDTEDDFINHAISFYLKNNYECYYFGGSEDGAMRTNKTNITIDGDNFNFYFEKSGSNKGTGLTGEKDDKYYLAGMLVKAGSDEKYQVLKKVTLSNGKVAYQKLDDAPAFLADVKSNTTDAIGTKTGSDKVTVGKTNTVTKKAEDLKEAYNITGLKAGDYVLVNTSGTVVDKKGKSKDGDDYVYVTNKSGVIEAVYVED